MKSMEITAVGIDVSKSKSTVAIRRPGGVIVACPFDISHSSHDLEKLVSFLCLFRLMPITDSACFVTRMYSDKSHR